jgi:trimeric autotransporter adhesin
MIKKYILIMVALINAIPGIAQNVAINTDGSVPNPNAMLDIKSSNKGILIPRTDSTTRKTIANTKGLLIYDTTTHTFWFNTGAAWQNLATGWGLSGNGGISATSNFIGTTDNTPLIIKVNNHFAGKIENSVTKNFLLGYDAGVLNTGGFNTALGYEALHSNTTGSRNVAVGSNAIGKNDTTWDNVAVGNFALSSHTAGNGNVAIGSATLLNDSAGLYNTAVGTNTMYENTSGQYNVAIGRNALFRSKATSANVAVGARSLGEHYRGNGIVSIGYEALAFDTAGLNNTAIGHQAMRNNKNGSDNTAFGRLSLSGNLTGSYNTAVGAHSLSENLGSGFNTAIGFAAMRWNQVGQENTAVGVESLLLNTHGERNTALGKGSLYWNKANDNTAAGHNALLNNGIGANNTAIGVNALISNVTGGGITAIGYNTNVSDPGLTNATVIGAGAIVDASHKVRIGNSAVVTIEGSVAYTHPSDGRYKFNIKEDVRGLEFICRLRPVSYQFDGLKFDQSLSPGNAALNNAQALYAKAASIRRNGFIAQEVEKAADEAGYEFSGIIKPSSENGHYSLSYESFVVPLVKAVQELKREIDDLKKEVAELKAGKSK